MLNLTTDHSANTPGLQSPPQMRVTHAGSWLHQVVYKWSYVVHNTQQDAKLQFCVTAEITNNE